MPCAPTRALSATVQGHKTKSGARASPETVACCTRKDAPLFQLPVCLVDLLATAAEVVGSERPASAQDSHSLLSLLRGEPNGQRPPVIHHSANGVFAIRDGKWKLVLGNGSGGRHRTAC